jgi:cation diffusion facilitator CzcD-associated flavoprotein CzcO
LYRITALHRTLNNDNVELVYDPIDTITESGIKCKSGKEHDIDVLILGTGFDVVRVFHYKAVSSFAVPKLSRVANVWLVSCCRTTVRERFGNRSL